MERQFTSNPAQSPLRPRALSLSGQDAVSPPSTILSTPWLGAGRLPSSFILLGRGRGGAARYSSGPKAKATFHLSMDGDQASASTCAALPFGIPTTLRLRCAEPALAFAFRASGHETRPQNASDLRLPRAFRSTSRAARCSRCFVAVEGDALLCEPCEPEWRLYTRGGGSCP